jgi:nucleolar protein 56
VAREIVSRWFGVFLVDNKELVEKRLYPSDLEALKERHRIRNSGQRTAEEGELLSSFSSQGLVTHDRRLTTPGVRLANSPPLRIEPGDFGFDLSLYRQILLEGAEQSLEKAWDPSAHAEEAVRAMADVEETLNLLGERLTNWAGRDTRLSSERNVLTPRGAISAILEKRHDGAVPDPERAAEPALLESRARLAATYVELEKTLKSLEGGIELALPRRAPNLTALLGATLAAKMISKANGLERLARLPASTVQVLGAERSFFEHLRGRAPPPRHGLLFVHPAIQSAPRWDRGRLARALAGKVSIAARLDLAHRPLRPELKTAFEDRARRLKEARRGKPKVRPRAST